jgi:hypothetical protein
MTIHSGITIIARSAALAAGLTLMASGMAWAGSTVRDHRGADGAPTGGVTVNGRKAHGGRPAPAITGGRTRRTWEQLGNPGGGGVLRGVTVRDHRRGM